VRPLLGLLLAVAATVAYPWIMGPLWALLVLWVWMVARPARPRRLAIARPAPVSAPTDSQLALWAGWAEVNAIERGAGLTATPWPETTRRPQP
jgi:hypothetical protein